MSCCGPLWVQLVWDTLYFLDLYVYFLHQIRELFFHYFFIYIFNFLPIPFWHPYDLDVVKFGDVPEDPYSILSLSF